jgi:hypothetical protein
MRRSVLVVVLATMMLVMLVIAGFVFVPRWFAPATVEVPRADAKERGEATGRIRASLYYVAENGLYLTAVAADVPFGASAAEQARALVEAQLQPAPAPLAQAIAEGTKVRQIFVAEDGTAFVDLSKDAVTNHRGGSLDELFAVYAIVNAVTVNLPAVKAVQILVEGQEVDTLAGHVDLRHPLSRNMRWVGPLEDTDAGEQQDGTQGTGAPGSQVNSPQAAPTPRS